MELTAYSLFRNMALALLLIVAPNVAAQARTIKLLVLGDSLTAGFGLPVRDGFQALISKGLAAQGYNVQIIDAAVPGDTTAGGLARLNWALADGADAAIVELGGNDMERGLDPRVIEANLTAILNQLSARHVKILLSGMLALPNLGKSYGDSFAAVYQRLGARSGVLFDPFFLQGVALDPALTQPGRIHPNMQGEQIIAARMLPLVVRLIKEVPDS